MVTRVRTPFDRQTLLATIAEEVEAGTMELVSTTDSVVEVLDFEEGKTIRFRTCPITQEIVENTIRISPNAVEDGWRKPLIARTLLHLPCEMFAVLENIFIVSSESDVTLLCDEAGIDSSAWPDSITFDDSEPSVVGCAWFGENSVIINLHAIKKTAERIWNGFPSYYVEKEIEIGFWTTLFHELRHLMLDFNPFLSEDDYPVSLAAESEVEKYGNAIYKKFSARGWL